MSEVARLEQLGVKCLAQGHQRYTCFNHCAVTTTYQIKNDQNHIRRFSWRSIPWIKMCKY